MLAIIWKLKGLGKFYINILYVLSTRWAQSVQYPIRIAYYLNAMHNLTLIRYIEHKQMQNLLYMRGKKKTELDLFSIETND